MSSSYISKPIHAELIDCSDYCSQANSTAELHGVFIGLLCRDIATPAALWVQAVELEGQVSDTRFHTVREQLDNVWNYALQSLNHIETEFEPLLPGDEEPLSVRSAELGAWCQGFLYGFSLSDTEESEDLPSVVAEILQDVVEISQVASDFDGEDAESYETDEAAYVELVEYLRVSVQLVFEEMAGQKMAGRKEPIYVDPRYMRDYPDDDAIH